MDLTLRDASCFYLAKHLTSGVPGRWVIQLWLKGEIGYLEPLQSTWYHSKPVRLEQVKGNLLVRKGRVCKCSLQQYFWFCQNGELVTQVGQWQPSIESFLCTITLHIWSLVVTTTLWRRGNNGHNDNYDCNSNQQLTFVEHLPCASHCAKLFRWLSHVNLIRPPRGHAKIILIVQVRILRLRVVTWQS